MNEGAANLSDHVLPDDDDPLLAQLLAQLLAAATAGAPPAGPAYKRAPIRQRQTVLPFRYW